MSIAVALLAAAAFGTADFLGGVAGRRASSHHLTGALTVPAAAQIAGLAVLAITATVATLLGISTVPAGLPLSLAAGAGLGNAVGVAALYRGLTVGRMVVVAPIAAAVTSLVPVTIGSITGERPSLTVWTGVVLAIIAATVVSRTHNASADVSPKTSGWQHGVVAGLGLATALSLLASIGTTDILWSLVSLKAAATAVLALGALASRQQIAPPRPVAIHVLAVGVLDAAALGAYQWSTTRQLLLVAAVLVSLYPVITVVLARHILGESMSRPQLAGVAAAMLGVSLIAVG